MKIRDQLAQLKKIAPNHTRFGELYRYKKDTKGATTHVVLYTLFVSDAGNWLLRPHVFKKKDPRTAEQWAAFFKSELHEVQKRYILPAINTRTGGQEFWSVYRIVGWMRGAKPVITNTGISARGDTSEEEGA